MSKTIRALMIVSGAAITFFFVIMLQYLYKNWSAQTLSAGDVGGFIGGLAAIIVLLANFIGFLWTLSEIKETREQQETSMERQDRLEEKVELIADSLNTIANNASLKSTLTVLESLPRLKVEERRGDGGTSSSHIIRYRIGILTFVNIGGRAEYLGAQSRTDGFHARLPEATVECEKGGRFRVHVECQSNLPEAGSFRLVLPFSDKFGQPGWTEISFPNFTATPSIKNHPGQPE